MKTLHKRFYHALTSCRSQHKGAHSLRMIIITIFFHFCYSASLQPNKSRIVKRYTLFFAHIVSVAFMKICADHMHGSGFSICNLVSLIWNDQMARGPRLEYHCVACWLIGKWAHLSFPIPLHFVFLFLFVVCDFVRSLLTFLLCWVGVDYRCWIGMHDPNNVREQRDTRSSRWLPMWLRFFLYVSISNHVINHKYDWSAIRFVFMHFNRQMIDSEKRRTQKIKSLSLSLSSVCTVHCAEEIPKCLHKIPDPINLLFVEDQNRLNTLECWDGDGWWFTTYLNFDDVLFSTAHAFRFQITKNISYISFRETRIKWK